MADVFITVLTKHKIRPTPIIFNKLGIYLRTKGYEAVDWNQNKAQVTELSKVSDTINSFLGNWDLTEVCLTKENHSKY